MFTLAIGFLLAVPGYGHSDFTLKGLTPFLTSLEFRGTEMRRADEPAVEALVLSLSDGEDVVLDLTASEELRRLGICGSRHIGTHDVMVTGCEDEDRSITIAGHGSWEYEASSATFRRVDDEDVLNDCGSVEPPSEDEDAMSMKAAMKEMMAEGTLPMHSQFETRAFDAEVRYYYDISLLERYGNDHERAKAAVRELNEHGKVLMRHDSLGMPIHLVMRVEPVFVDLRTHAGPPNALDDFIDWLSGRSLCGDRTIAFHHLITNHRVGDGVAGVAFIGTVCHSRCFNTGITEISSSVARAATVLAHEMGHNLGAQHTFHASNEGRDCRGIMSYGVAPDTWSICAREDWEMDYASFVRSFGQSRADSCLVPSNGAPAPAPSPTGAAPTARPTPPPVQRPTNPPGGPVCRTFPGLDISGREENSGVTGITSDTACNSLCLDARGCTIWVREPSTGTCWLLSLTGNISLVGRPDRVVGLRCRSTTPVPAPTARPTLPPTLPPTLSPTIPPTLSPTTAPTVLPTSTPTALPTSTPTALPTATPTALPTSTPTIANPMTASCMSLRARDCATARGCEVVRIGGLRVCRDQHLTPASAACESLGATECARSSRCELVESGAENVCITPCELIRPRDCPTNTRCELVRMGSMRMCKTPEATQPPADARCDSFGARDCAGLPHCELVRIEGERVCRDLDTMISCGSLSNRKCASSLSCEVARVDGLRQCVALAASHVA